MKNVYVVSFYPEGASKPEVFVFGGRNMAQRFVVQMTREHGIESEDILVKQYVVMTESQLQGHYGVKSEA